MKKLTTFVTLGAALFATTSLTSCEEETELPGRVPDVPRVFSSAYDFTELDQVQLAIEVGSGVESIALEIAGESLPMNFEAGKASFNASLSEVGLGEESVASSAFTFVIKELSGETLTYDSKFTRSTPFAFTVPSLIQKNNMDTLWVEVATKNAAIDTKEVLYKVVKKGEEAEGISYMPTTAEWNEGKLGLVLDGSSYDVADTIMVKAMAEAGDLSAEAETSTVVDYYTFGSEVTGKVFDKMNTEFSLWLNDTSAMAQDVKFVQEGFMTNLVGMDVSYEEGEEDVYVVSRAIEFVVADANYELGDIVATKSLFDQGTSVSTLNDLREGDVFIFKISETKMNKADEEDKMMAEKWGVVKVTSEERPSDANGMPTGNNKLVVDYRYVVEM
ncbi:hypothetical protein [Sediminitomix flava]|uniref:Uncharacterized protein n=1 Tax=Sediminitomix flava TaxID=379075 RepID=A0A315Z7Z3_SEDFL|nr:hypothetical protein [Sediminitomix flava]PWJ40977.1 hypothetical protein BC781_104243 [Sediminitomix flava]